MTKKIEPGTLTTLMDELFQIGVPIESVRIIAIGVRQAVKDATPKAPATPKTPRGFLRNH